MNYKGKVIDFSCFRKKGDNMNTMTSPMQALDVAKWFIKYNYDTPSNSFDGNMKLQKLLYFSQLVHLAKTGYVLFNDDMYAFEKGTVIETVRNKYKNDCINLKLEAKMSDIYIPDEQLDTIQIVADIFGDINALELSELNHLQKSWKETYEYSLIGNIPHKVIAQIPIQKVIEKDLEKVKEMLDGYYASKNIESEFIELNEKRFYYNSDEIEITDEIIEILKDFSGDDISYSIYYNDIEGLVIY